MDQLTKFRTVAYVDIIDACQLKCPTCVRGIRTMENSSGKMSLEQFGQIIEKLKVEGYPVIGLFNWTEPFLNRTLQNYILKVNQLELLCDLSTTLALRRIDNLEECLRAGVNRMTVSMSGMDQATYEINHVGGVLEYVFANLEKTADIIRRFSLPNPTFLRFIKFDYNAHQVDDACEYANKIGVRFEVIQGSGNPRADVQFKADNAIYVKEIGKTLDKIAPEDSGKVCSLMFDQAAVDYKGDAYLCCAVPNHAALRIGQYLEFTEDQLLLRRYNHPFCRACTLPRRDATASDKRRLVQAVESRMGLAAAPVSSSTETYAAIESAC